MELDKAQFNEQFSAALDTAMEAMADHEAIDPKKFYSVVCILENLQFFAPVIYDAIKKKKA